MESLNFLVVDDMKTMRTMVKMSLRKCGAKNILEAQDGKDAWALLLKIANETNLKVDFIISDWNMPIMTGIELLQNCRGHEKYQDIPFLLVTAEQDAEQVKQALLSKVDGYIVKPFTQAGFETRLAGIFKKKLPGIEIKTSDSA